VELDAGTVAAILGPSGALGIVLALRRGSFSGGVDPQPQAKPVKFNGCSVGNSQHRGITHGPKPNTLGIAFEQRTFTCLQVSQRGLTLCSNWLETPLEDPCGSTDL
jgi:hypothetical protein